MDSSPQKKLEPTDVLYRMKRGLAAYVSYLAACEMNQAFSEYVLYEPILRILMSRGYSVQCEFECPGIRQPDRGDKKRLDFYAIGHGLEMAIEVKWIKFSNTDFTRDLSKLRAVKSARPDSYAILCVFGRKSILQKLDITGLSLRERGKPIYADLRKTKFGCRIFQLQSPPSGLTSA